jgi:hypothetical protein
MMPLSELVVDPFADKFGDDASDNDSSLISQDEAEEAGSRSVTELFEGSS